MLKLNLSNLSPELRAAAEELLPQIGITAAEDGLAVDAQQWDNGLSVTVSNTVKICWQHKYQFFRGLSHIKQVLRTGASLEEKPAFEWLSYMTDVSRNGAMTLPAIKKMIRWLAAMGYNDMMLYMEDVYELPGYPYFGYQRGRYTKDELKELVAYGERFGITLTPCIQTLGHLRMPLLWSAHKEMKDSDDVLYVGKEETYQFIEAIFQTVCECFKTRRVNIGMDEAHTLGMGRRLRKEGYTKKPELMTMHLARVGKLCEKYGLQPLIWSDMFFRPHTPGNGYYSTDVNVPQAVIDGVPDNFTLVYWDYYNSDIRPEKAAMFDHMIREHKRFRNPIAFAGGIWKWTGYAPNNRGSLPIARFHADVCIREGIRDITVTAWGDDGAEASHFTPLPGLLMYAEKLNRNSTEEMDIAPVFEELFGISLEAFLLLDIPNAVPDGKSILLSPSFNPSKWLLYGDPLCGRADRWINPCYSKFYAECEKTLATHKDHETFGYLFETLTAMCAVLKNKATLSLRLREAYLAGNKEGLATVIAAIPETVVDLDRFIEVLRQQWYLENRLFGFETLEMRLGALRARLLGVEKTVQMYLEGRIDNIAPLAEPLLYPDGKTADDPQHEINTFSAYYNQIVPVTFLQD